jgi:transcription-repair coupling factor (superfamily II helicase)
MAGGTAARLVRFLSWAQNPHIKRVNVAFCLVADRLADVSQRLILYKRLAGADGDAELGRIRDEILDRYGPLPPETENLMEVIRIKIAARRLV